MSLIIEQTNVINNKIYNYINNLTKIIPKILNNVNIRDKSLKIIQFLLRFIISTFRLSLSNDLIVILQDTVNMCSNSRKFFRLFRYINCYANIINLLYILNYQINDNNNIQFNDERIQVQLNGISQIPIEYLSHSAFEKTRTIIKIGEQVCWSMFFWYDSLILWARLSSQNSSNVERYFYRCWFAADIFHLFDHLVLFVHTLSNDIKQISDLRQSRPIDNNITNSDVTSLYKHSTTRLIQLLYDVYTLQCEYTTSSTNRGKVTAEVIKSIINLFVSSSFNPTIDNFYKSSLSKSSLIVKDCAVTVFALISSVNSIRDSV